MRRPLSIAALLVCSAVVATGCGSNESSSGALDSALSYLPKKTPFAIAIDTNLRSDQYKSLDTLLQKFPGADTIKALLKAQVEKGAHGLSFDRDLKPLLGHPFVVSATSVSSFLGNAQNSEFVAAIKVDDKNALNRLVDRTKPRKQGQVAGGTVYEQNGTFFAVNDDMVVLGGSRSILEAALRRANGGNHLDSSTFEKGLAGLPTDVLARVYVDIQALLEQRQSTVVARKITWVGALRTLGLTVSVDKDSIDVKFNLRTDGSMLSGADLPLAPGDKAAQVVQEPGQINVGIRDPSQIFGFFETAFQAVNPRSFGDYEKVKLVLSRRLHLDVNRDVVAQLKRDLSISVGLDGSFGARAELKDPNAFKATVDKLAKALPQLGSAFGVQGVARHGNLYEARLKGGGRIAFGVRGGVFVAASDAARALKLASERPKPVPGAKGSVVLSADAGQLGTRLLQQLAPKLGLPPSFPAALFARPLRSLTGSASSSTDGMKGQLSLTFD